MEKQFSIEGMSCNHCVLAVEKELNKLDLQKSKVEIGSAVVEFDPSKVEEKDIISAITEAGFSVSE